uniref:L1 transposable element RRM domain-containing protein n=1 Tax=Poecilia formosa TaxID=48698 RepID=A0A087YKM8_POEFO
QRLALVQSMLLEFIPITMRKSKCCEMDETMENVKKDVNECAERVGEDNITNHQARVQVLETKTKDLEGKVLDLEARSRRSNLRLVNLPEGAEGEDACAFLEKWLQEVLNLAPLRTTLTLERAHRLGQRSTSNTVAPRTLIMKFLNYKVTVIRAARTKGQILFKNHPVRFYGDLAAGVHKKTKSLL